MMTWNEVVRSIDHKEAVISVQDLTISHLATDSRTAKDGSDSLFFAVTGEQHDGHSFVRDMYEKGCRAFITEKRLPTSEYPQSNFLVVSSAIHALQQMATWHRQRFDIPVIGIAGSNGKTTVKEWLGIVLEKGFRITKNPKSYNSQIGVPLSVWQLSPKSELGIFEAGISRSGEMEKLEPIVLPTIGIFTSLGQAHAEGFSSTREKLMEKAKLFLKCEKLIYSRDNELVYETLSKLYPVKSVIWSSQGENADYSYTVVSNHVVLKKDGVRHDYKLPFDFGIWVSNALHVITCALELGCKDDIIQKGLQQLKPVDMRLQLKEGRNGTYIVDDTYNNDFQALGIALEFLGQQKQRTRKTVILSDLLQSGIDDENLYEQVGHLLKQHNIDRLVGVGEKVFRVRGFDGEKEFFKTTDDLMNKLPEFRDEMILVKGARTFGLERIVTSLQYKNHRTELRINFEAIRHNLLQYRKLLDSKTHIMAMVKAFGYGGGSHEIANFLQFQGVDYLGVAYLDEAISLRDHGISIPIMVMNPDQGNLGLIHEYQLEPEIYSHSLLKAITMLDQEIAVHLKIETGMNRLGFNTEELPEVLNLLKDNTHVSVKGIFTHLSSSEDPNDDTFTKSQIELFNKACNQFKNKMGYLPMRHALNSGGIVRWPEYHFDMVRLGIGLYGFDTTGSVKLRPVSSLVSRISQIKEVGKGSSVGYNRKGKTRKKTRIATVEIGYADGYSRVFGNGIGKINLHGHLCPTIGNICMDMTMIDVTGVECKEGDAVTIFGITPDIQDLASWSNTIPYEILTSINSRVQRVYQSE